MARARPRDGCLWPWKGVRARHSVPEACAGAVGRAGRAKMPFPPVERRARPRSELLGRARPYPPVERRARPPPHLKGRAGPRDGRVLLWEDVPRRPFPALGDRLRRRGEFLGCVRACPPVEHRARPPPRLGGQREGQRDGRFLLWKLVSTRAASGRARWQAARQAGGHGMHTPWPTSSCCRARFRHDIAPSAVRVVAAAAKGRPAGRRCSSARLRSSIASYNTPDLPTQHLCSPLVFQAVGGIDFA